MDSETEKSVKFVAVEVVASPNIGDNGVVDERKDKSLQRKESGTGRSENDGDDESEMGSINSFDDQSENDGDDEGDESYRPNTELDNNPGASTGASSMGAKDGDVDEQSEHDADDEGDDSGNDPGSESDDKTTDHEDEFDSDSHADSNETKPLDTPHESILNSSDRSVKNIAEKGDMNRKHKPRPKRISFKARREKSKTKEEKERNERRKSTRKKSENYVTVDSDEDKSERPRATKIVDRSPTKRYVRFNQLLGEGSFKKVYLAYDSQQGVEVAWNVVKIGNVKKEFMQRTLQEMKILQTMNHPHIIKFYASWLKKETQSVVFVTEMMSSGTLKEFIRNRPVRVRIVKRWSRHILQALQYMHEDMHPAIIHRDLKCDNIFINGATGDIRIGDMGLASWERNGNAKSVLGTPEYMAPEMFEENYDEKVDIYAFGMCVLEMVTKETPYLECSSTPQIYRKVMANILPDAFYSVMNSPIKTFIHSCIKKPGKDESRPSASLLRQSLFLKKTENDPEDDIDCEEYIDKSSEKRKSRIERKLSTTSITDSQNTENSNRVINSPENEELNKPSNQAQTNTRENASEHNDRNSQVSFMEPNLNTATESNIKDGVLHKTEGYLADNGTASMPQNTPEVELKSNETTKDMPQPAPPNGRRMNRHDSNQSGGSAKDSDPELISTLRKIVSKGTDVVARFAGDETWFPGKIERINSNGSYDIKYEDNDYETGVMPELIQIVKEGGETVPLVALVAEYQSKQNVDVETVSQQPTAVPPQKIQGRKSPHMLRRHSTSGNDSEQVKEPTRWEMIASNPGGSGTHLNELTIQFNYNRGVSATFPFNLEVDQASAVAAELVETLNLAQGELDTIALHLLRFRHEYETFRQTNLTEPFRVTVERDAETRISLGANNREDTESVESKRKSAFSLGSAASSAADVNEDTSKELSNLQQEDTNDSHSTKAKSIVSRPTEEEVAEYDRKILKEEEKIRKLQADYEKRVEALKQQKEQARAQRTLKKAQAQQNQSGTVSTAQAKTETVAEMRSTIPVAKSQTQLGSAVKIGQLERNLSMPTMPQSQLERKLSLNSVKTQESSATVNLPPTSSSASLQVKPTKTKEELREEAKAKVEFEKAIKKETLKAESAVLEEKIAGLDTFCLRVGEVEESQPLKTVTIPPKPNLGMSLNEKRQKDQLHAMTEKQKGKFVGNQSLGTAVGGQVPGSSVGPALPVSGGAVPHGQVVPGVRAPNQMAGNIVPGSILQQGQVSGNATALSQDSAVGIHQPALNLSRNLAEDQSYT